MTPAELRVLSDACVDTLQPWIGAMVFEKLGFNYEIITYATAGNKSVVFAQPYAVGVTDIDVRVKAFDADGEDIGGQIDESSVDNTGFDVYVGDACTLMFISFQPKVTVPL